MRHVRRLQFFPWPVQCVPVKLTFWVALCALLVLASGCRQHDLLDGDYAITPTEILRDDCGLQRDDPVGLGTLDTDGNLVGMTFAQLGLRLVGTYRFSTEEMTLDGTLSNYSVVLRGAECLVDTVNLHLDTQTTSPTSFNGAMSINYDARQNDACVCKYWFKLDATRR